MAVIEGIGDEVFIYGTAFVALAIGFCTLLSRYLPQLNPAVVNNTLDESTTDPARSYNTDTCPICLGSPRLAVGTSCGHKFCGQCIRSYINNRGGGESFFSGGLPCPICRQKINLLLISFSRDADADEEERRQVENSVYEYNVRFGNGPRSVMTYIRDCPILIRHLIANFFSYNGILWVFRMRVIFCLAGAVFYFIIPLDIIPEAMFGIFGLLDDVFILFVCAIYLSIIYRRLLVNDATQAEM